MTKRRPPPVEIASPPSRFRKWWVLFAGAATAGVVIVAATALRSKPAGEQPITTQQFLLTVENKNRPARPAPDGMVWIPGGEFSMGAQAPPHMGDTIGMQATEDSRPVHRVHVDGFWMDSTEVTNEQFAAFVKATGYVTLAERTPRAEDLPTVAPENLVAGSAVFSPPSHPVPLDDNFQWWAYAKGASWRHPLGPKSSIVGKERFPVVQVAYEDAVAYAKWAGKRLPTEAEWEFAARGGLTGKVYPWGDEFADGGQLMANTMFDQHADIIFAAAGKSGLGVSRVRAPKRVPSPPTRITHCKIIAAPDILLSGNAFALTRCPTRG